MNKINTSFGLLTRTGLVLSGLVAITVSASAIDAASAQTLKSNFDSKSFELKRKAVVAKGTGDAVLKNDVPSTLFSVNTKGDQEEGDSGKKVFPKIAIGKGDREENEVRTGNKQIVIGKGDQAEDNEPPKKRQVIVEPKPVVKKKVKVAVNTEPVVKKSKKIILAKAEAPAKKVVIADAAPDEVETPAETPEVETEAPAAEAPAEETTTDEQAEAETPAAPQQKFEVGQIVTGADGKSYVIVKIDDNGISAMPLAAFAEYEQPKKVYKKKRKKRYSGYGYSSSRSYGGSSCN